MKVQDPNHMITVGEEGFYATSAPAASLETNPDSDGTGYAVCCVTSCIGTAVSHHARTCVTAPSHTCRYGAS